MRRAFGKGQCRPIARFSPANGVARFALGAAIAWTSVVGLPAGHDLFGRARAEIPVENIKFDDPDLQALAQRGARAVNACDPWHSHWWLRHLRARLELLQTSRNASDQAVGDMLKLQDFIPLLERDYAARCGRHSLDGWSGDNISYAFHNPSVRDRTAKPQMDRATQAAKDCKSIEFDQALAEMLRVAGLPGTHPEDANMLRRMAQDLRLERANLFKHCPKDASARTSVPPSEQPKPAADTSAPGEIKRDTVIGPAPTYRTRFDLPGREPAGLYFSRGGYGMGIFDETPPDFIITAGANIFGTSRRRVDFLTFFDPGAGREQAGAATDGSFNGAGFGISLDALMRSIATTSVGFSSARGPQLASRDLPELAQAGASPRPRFEGTWRARVSFDWLAYSGTQNAAIAPGTFNVAHTFIAPNPATGTTGILLGATGDAGSVKSHGDQIHVVANAIYSRPYPGPFGAGDIWYWSLGAGARLGIRWDEHEITQQSLTFSGINMTTELSTSEVFFGPNFVAGAGFDRGDIYVGANAYVAPGVLFINGSAKQTSLCNLCPNPLDRSIAQEISFDTTKFAFKTGVEVKGGYRFTRNFALEAAFGFHHTSQTGAVHNPITPNQQPAALFTGTANTVVGSIRAVIRW